MQSGVINKDSFAQVFRGLSQRRQQGTMEIHCGETIYKMQLIQGKVVEITEAGISPVQEVAEILRKAGFFETLEVGEGDTYRDLLNKAAPNARRSLDENVLKQVMRHRVLDKLYDLDFGSGSYYSFKLEMVDCDRDLAPMISIGQLLLDYVALETETPQFNALIDKGTFISQTNVPKSGLASEEEFLYEMIGKQGVELETLRHRSMLSRYHIIEGLLGLHKAGMIAFGEHAETGAAATEGVDAGDFLASLDSSIDALFEKETGLSAAAAAAEQEESMPEAGAVEEGAEAVAEEPVAVRVRLGVTSMRLLQSSWIPQTVALLMLIFCFGAPFLVWGRIFKYFGQP